MADEGKTGRREDRQARLESALRENLRRRKLQARARAAPPGGKDEADGGEAGPPQEREKA